MPVIHNMVRKGSGDMKITISEEDLLSRISVLFALPISVLIESNPHITSNQLSPGDKISIPGYWTRIERMPLEEFLHPIDRERIRFVNQNQGILSGRMVRVPVKIKHRIVDTTEPYSSAKYMNDIDILQTIFPFMKVTAIGYSSLGKEIKEMRIGCGKKKVHMNASIHANEWITSLVLMEWLNEYLVALTNGMKVGHCSALELFLECEVSIVGMANPDGVDLVIDGPPEGLESICLELNEGKADFHGWKADIEGIDLNRQFPANWDTMKERYQAGPGPRDYPGERPLTQKEAIALAELVRREDFDRVIALHTQGHEFYWGYNGHEPALSAIMAREFAVKTSYASIQYVDSHAGFKDWFIQEYKRPGFTIELGKGVNPLPLSQFKAIYEETKHLLNAAMYL